MVREVVGIGRAPLDEAVRLGAIDRWVTDPAEAIPQADVLLLAAPVRAIIEQAAQVAHLVRPGAVVTDVGSTKREIVRAWEQHLPPEAAFVGGHPMFGREVAGVQYASADLARGSVYVLTPGRRATADAIARVRSLAEVAGCRVHLMSPAEHDGRVATASHLPQLVATALAAAALDADERVGGVLELSANGFRDTTRIASSPAELWTDILLTNPEAIRAALLIFRESVDRFEDALIKGDEAALVAIFARAHEARRRLPRS